MVRRTRKARREAARRGAATRVQNQGGMCRPGLHKMTEDNIDTFGDGSRRCKACRRERAARDLEVKFGRHEREDSASYAEWANGPAISEGDRAEGQAYVRAGTTGRVAKGGSGKEQAPSAGEDLAQIAPGQPPQAGGEGIGDMGEIRKPVPCAICGVPVKLHKHTGRPNKTCGSAECMRASQAYNHRKRILDRIAAGCKCHAGKHDLIPENIIDNGRSIRCGPCHREATAALKKHRAEESAPQPVVHPYVPLYVVGKLSREDIDEIVERYEPGSAGPNGSVALAAEYRVSRFDLWEYIRVRKAEGQPEPERVRYRNFSASLGAMA